MIQLILSLFVLAGCWRIFQKMGRQGWEGIVPLYSGYVMCQLLYGQGWKILLSLIPLYNIYFAFKVHIDLAKAFHQGAGFGVGLTLLPVVFYPLLGFGSFTYGSGAQATHADDPISRTLDQVTAAVGGQGGAQSQAKSQPREQYQEQSQAWTQWQEPPQQKRGEGTAASAPQASQAPQAAPEQPVQQKDPAAMLEQLNTLRKAGVLSDEEYAIKKAELMNNK